MNMRQTKSQLKIIGSLATFANLDEFDTEILIKPLANITKLAKAIETKPISQHLNLTIDEIMERDNSQKLMQGGLRIVF